jgi:hypothetical protein
VLAAVPKLAPVRDPAGEDLAVWKAHWADLMDIETNSVITGAEAAQRVG